METEVRELFVKTEKSFASSLPRFVFEGKIVVVQSGREVERALDFIYDTARIVGIDSETRPSFRKGEIHKVALLQVSTEEVCFLFRLCMTGLTPSLVRFLSDDGLLKVGLSLTDDFMQLRRRQDFTPAGFVDLQHFVREMGIQDISLQKLYANVFRMRISKQAQRSNWERDVLTDSQKVYAATDAYTCLQLYNELSRLREQGNYVLLEAAGDEQTEAAAQGGLCIK